MDNNIWLAASDGDLERVKELVDINEVSPDVPDANTYTPLHAAASWGHEDVLRYLVSKGGNVNVTDSDGETPLFTVESDSMAHLLIELGANASHRNNEGKTAAEHHQEDSPSISAYLCTITGETLTPLNGDESDDDEDEAMDDVDDDLLSSAQAVMAEAERTGADPDPALRELVGAAVTGHLTAGRAIAPLPDTKRVRRDDVGR